MQILSLAARNLTRNLRRTLLTGAAIAFGLAMMIVMITMQAGQYREMLDQGISVMAGHVVIEHPDYAEEAEAELVVPDVDATVARLQEQFPDARITPRMQIGGLLTSPTNSVGIGLRGLDPAVEQHVIDLPSQIQQGEWLAPDDERGILIGVAMAERLAVEVGEKVVFMGQGEGGDVESRLFRVRGVFKTGGAELDGFVGVTSLAAAQALNRTPDAAHQVAVHLSDPAQTDAARTASEPLAPDGMAVMTWPEALPELVSMIEIDRISSDVISLIIALIVGMGVLNTMLMSVLERVREFGVLLGIGMRPRRLASLVVTEGLVLGVFATLVGILIGLGLSYPLVAYGLDYSAYIGEAMEVDGLVLSAVLKGAYDPSRMGWYALGTVLFTLVSTVYPAWYITRLEPVDAMRAV